MAEIGSIGLGTVVSIAHHGEIQSLDGVPILHWGIRADDRWHVARNEKAVRQGVAPDGVSIETRLRVPGGDIAHRTNVITHKGVSLVAVEIENETPVAVALALFTSSTGIVESEADTLSIDGYPFIRANKPIALFERASSEEDLLDTVGSEKMQRENSPAPMEGEHVAIVFPLPHATTIRFVIQVDATQLLVPSPDELPSLEAIAKGWSVHFEQGGSIELQDSRLKNTLTTARRHLLIGSEQEPTSTYWRHGVPSYAVAIAVIALCAWGHKTAAKRLLFRAIESQTVTVFQNPDLKEISYLLWACNEYLEFTESPEDAELIKSWATEQIVHLIRAIPRWRRRRSQGFSWLYLGLESSSSLLQKKDEEVAARQIRETLSRVTQKRFIFAEKDSLETALNDADRGSQFLLQQLNRYTSDSSGEGTFDESLANTQATYSFASKQRLQDPLASALFLLAVRRSFVTEPTGNTPKVAIFEGFSSSWFNVPIEVQNMPVHKGTIGYVIRWHGDRPALLWEGEVSTEVTFTSPKLDADWESTESNGETLFPQQIPKETIVSLISPEIHKGHDPPNGTLPGNSFS
jgi:hypothetical protein